MQATPCYTLEDLRDWRAPGTHLAVLGYPVRHSLSPEMHNAALQAMARSHAELAEWRYHRIEIPAEDLPRTLRQLAELPFHGVNLTIPHKVDAVSLVARVDEDAKALGAVNTLRREEIGWVGFNTDGYGIEKALEQELEVSFAGEDVILLGAGGAARAVAVQAIRSGCRSLWIGNRTADRLRDLLQRLQSLVEEKTPLHGFDLTAPPSSLPRKGIVINVTSLGLRAEDPAPIDLAHFHEETRVLDSTYGNPHNQLLRNARERGMRATDGLAMLVWQGVRSLEIWTGKPVPSHIMREAAQSALESRRK